jgi:hypothetical protein
LYLSAKTTGGYDDCTYNNRCTLVQPNVFVSPNMTQYFASQSCQNVIHYDAILYDAVDKSLDLTIDAIGREPFYENLNQFIKALHKRVVQRLYFHVMRMGHVIKKQIVSNMMLVVVVTCLDEVANKLDLW